MMAAVDYNEALISRLPIVVRRRALWTECDPARVVFTGHFFSYLSSAYGWFARIVVDGDGAGLAGPGIVAPIKAISIEFQAMLRAGDWVDITALLGDVRTRTFDVDVICTRLDGTSVFTARISPILADDVSKVAVAIPDRLRASFEAYRAGQVQAASG